MKRLFTLALLFISAFGIAQHPVSLFKTQFNALPEQINTDLNPHIRQYTLLQPEQSVWTTLLAQRPQTLMLTLPFEGGMTLDLEKTNPLAHDFILTASSASGGTDTLDYEPGLHYKGKIAGAAQSLVAISIFEDQIIGVISDAQSNINLGRVNTDAARASNMYVMFRDKELVNPQGFACGTPDDPDVNLPVDIARPAEIMDNNLPVNMCPIRIYIDCTHNFFLVNGSSSNNASNNALANFNIAKTIFSNENIDVVISEIHVWTAPDPFYHNNSTDALLQFESYFYPNGVNGNIGLLLMPENVGGVAWRDKLCASGNNYALMGGIAYPNPYPNYSYGAAGITHELGHSFGSWHTHSCNWPGGAIDNCANPEGNCGFGPPPVNGGTIMSYCDTKNPPSYYPLSNGFGPLPGAKIRDRAMNVPCLKVLNDYFGSPTVCGCVVDEADKNELWNLYWTTGGPSWTTNTNWLNVNDFNWYGVRWVKVGNKCKVRYISLHENNLSGQVPNLNLPELQRLILDKNHLTGQIPAYNLPKLFALQLDSNLLSGSIPTFNLPELWYLDLTNNNLTGSIPAFSFPKLEYLWVADNQLTGTIPNFNLPKLKSIWFAYNQLSGGIPNFNFPDLEYLGFHGNQLSGSIPNFNLPNLGRMVLWSNQFSGSIPNFNLPKLFYLDLSYNQLSGPVPNFNFPNMRYFYLGYNSTLNGTIPNFNFPDVRSFWLAGNQFTGQIPAFNFPKVTYFGLHQNQLTGTIPTQNLPNADSLRFDYNNLTFNGLYQFFPNNRSYFLYTPQAKIPTYTTPNCNTMYVRAGGVTAHNTYKWYKVGTGLISTIVGDSLFSPVSTGQYYCEVTNSVVTGLTLTSETVQKGATYVAISGTTTICAGGNTILNAGNGYAVYHWSNGASTQQITVNTAGNYTVTVTDNNGCSATATATISQLQPITITLVSSVPPCPNTSNGSITVSASGINGNYTYAWSNGATGASISNLSSGSYVVTVTAPGACSNTLLVNLTTTGNPVVNFNANISGLTVSYVNNTTNAASFSWDFGNGVTSVATNPVVTYAAPGNYQVCLTAFGTGTCGTSTSCTSISVSNTPAMPLTLQTGFTPTQIAQTMFGNGCMTVSNVNFQGNAAQMGKFSGGPTNIGINKGIILSTGRVIDADGPNDANVGGSFSTNTITDSDLSVLYGPEPIYDRAILEFDFVPTIPNIEFNFVFASEEYCEFVNQPFRDGFLLLVNGPGINGTFSNNAANYALVPNTNLPITTDNISHLTNSAYYLNNIPVNAHPCVSIPAYGVAPQEVQYDGFTRKIKSNLTLQVGQTYHVRLKIADSGDDKYDSAVFFEAGTYQADTVALTLSGPDNPMSGATATYTISPAGATSYTWTPPPGASINGQPAGQAVTLPAANNSVSVTFDCGWGELCVQATSGCIQSAPACKFINFYNNVYTDIPLCNQTVPGGDEIHLACIYTDLNGLHGSNIGYTADPGPIGFCGSVETGVWYGFVATNESMTFTVTPTTTILNNGLQLALTDREGNSLACGFGEANSFPLPTQVSYDALIPGKVYYLFVESFGGDECNFIISTTPSVNQYLLPSLGTISPTIQGPSSICPGTSVVMSVPPVDNALRYIWQGPAGTLFNGDPWPVYLGPEGHTVTVTFANTSGHVAVMAANGCDFSGLSTKQVNVGALPPTILPSIVVCNNDAPYITPWGDEVYTSGTYQTTLTAANGCDSIVRQTVVIKPPIMTILPTQIICHGESVTICGQTYSTPGVYVEQCQSWQGCDSIVTMNLIVFDVVAKITGGSVICSGLPLTIGSLPSMGQKVWRDGSGQVIGVGSEISVIQQGTYILTASFGPCIAYDTINVTESNGAPPTIATFGGVITCLSPTLTIGATSATQGLSYEWYGPNGFTASQQFINVSAGGYYVVKATTPEGCSDVDTALVSLEPVFNIDLNISTEPSGLTCQATAIPSAGEPPLMYVWSNGQTTQTATGILPGPFAVTIIDVLGCSATTTGACMSVGTAQPDAPEVFTVQPNPASDLLTIQVKMQQETHINLQLINALGQVVFENNYQAQEFEEVLNVQNLTPGCYFLQLNNGQYRKAIIVSIIR